MAGCLVAQDPCNKPIPDVLSTEEQANIEVIRALIDRVWNYRWTADDEAVNAAQYARGDHAYVPSSVATAINELRSPYMVRHRQDARGNRIKAEGADDYKLCVNTVHGIAPDLHVSILDIVASKDTVVAHLALEGTDRPIPSRPSEGAFGVRPPTGKRYRTQTATMYRLESKRIVEDWLLYGGLRLYGI